jgi:hypothetical protein
MATTYTVSAGDYIRPWKNVEIKQFPVHVSQTVLIGSVVQKAGAGYENRVILSTDTVTTGIIGVSLDALTTTGTHDAVNDRILVALAKPDAEFIGRVVADTAVDFSHIGTNYELEIDATYSITRVQTDGTTYEVVKVLAFLDPVTMNAQATEGDTSAWAVFRFIPGASVWGVGIILQ